MTINISYDIIKTVINKKTLLEVDVSSMLNAIKRAIIVALGVILQFGFMQPDPDNPTKLVLAEKATDNVYHLSINRYSVTVQFQHVRTGEVKLICDISNFAMNTHNMMNVIIKCVDYWLQYGVVYDYVSAQGFREIE